MKNNSENLSLRIRIGRMGYLILAIIFTLFLIMQVYLAGMAAFFYEIN